MMSYGNRNRPKFQAQVRWPDGSDRFDLVTPYENKLEHKLTCSLHESEDKLRA